MSEEHRDKVTWTGFLKGEQLAETYASSDVFLFPSPTETFGNVVLEALASGLPVIGANCGGVKNLVIDGKTGFLCEPKNLRAFRYHLEKVLTNPELRSTLSIEARKFALHLSWEEIFHQLIASFAEVEKLKNAISKIA